MIKKEKLPSRYKDVDTIAYLYDEDTAIITSTGNYARYIFEENSDKELCAIDFEGGPYLQKGDIIFDKKIKDIKHGYIIELE